MSDAGSKDKAVTPASNPLNNGDVMGDIGLYEVLAVVDIKAYIVQLGPVTSICAKRPKRQTLSTDVINQFVIHIDKIFNSRMVIK